MMLLEKCQNKEDIQNTLIELRMLTKDKERIEWIEDLITYVFPDVLGEDTEKMLEIIRWKEEKNMEDLVERIKKNEEKMKRALIRKGKNEGKKESLIEVIINMLKRNEDEEKIMEYTNVKKDELEKIKKEMQMQN